MTTEQISFSYRAQSAEGRPVSGTIDAESVQEAQGLLRSMQLQVMEIEPAEAPPARGKISGADLAAFNQQLAHLAAAGLPLERGLRLIARDLERGRLAGAVRQLAEDLEKGVPLAEAFGKQTERFGPAYGRLIEAGVRTNNLPGMLLGLNRHLQTISMLRNALWRAAAYPLVVLVALCVVVAFIMTWVLPKFSEIYLDFGVRLPAITQFMVDSGRGIGTGAMIAGGGLVGAVLVFKALAAMGRQELVLDAIVLRIPLIGTVIRRSLIAQWCETVRLAVIGGLDLPLAMRLAGDVSGSGRLRRDSHALAATLEGGHPLDMEQKFSVMSASVPAAIELASHHRGLADTLTTLGEMYQQQAQARAGLIPALLTPILLLLLTSVIGFIIAALLMPLVQLIRSVSGI